MGGGSKVYIFSSALKKGVNTTEPTYFSTYPTHPWL